MKIFRNVLIGVLVLAIIVVGSGVWFIRSAWPEVSGTTTIDGLSEPVRIIRDEWGVPHIYAENERDLFMAQGFVHAQDRLWQMEYRRHVGSGTVSSIIGERAIAYDQSIRTIGLRRAAEREWAQLDEEMRGILEAYADGVNAYIDANRNQLPIEFTLMGGYTPAPWEPIDTLTYGYVTSFSLAGNHRLEFLRARIIAGVGEEVIDALLPPYEDDKPIIIPEEAHGYESMAGMEFTGFDALADMLGDPGASWGSNNWVVHGSRTETGMPILASDTHLNLDVPSSWYANGLHGGRFDVVGTTFPGVPGVIVGHNNNIAWSVTNLNPDVQDLFIEKLDDAENPTQYEFEGEWQDLEIVNETIEVKGQESIDFNVYITRHGPIINDAIDSMADADPMSLRWAGVGESALFEGLIRINLSQNWDEFRNAVSFWDVPSQNFLYADVEGNIGYQMSGQIPIRPSKTDGLVPVPGWTGEHDWEGYIPFEELPTILNPSQGFLATANNKIVGDDYPYVIAHEWDPGFRAARITQLLEENQYVDIDYIQQMHADTYSLPAEALRPYLLDIEPENEAQEQALQYVGDWDLRYETDQVGASIYQTWYWFLLNNTLNDDLSEDLANDYLAGQYERHGSFQVPTMIAFMKDPDNPWFDDKTTSEIETRDDIVQQSLVDALDWLNEGYGSNPERWTWGNLHQMTFYGRPFGRMNPVLGFFYNSEEIPARGDNFTINAASFSFSNPFKMNHGVSQRQIVDLGNLDNMLTVQATGQSERIWHPNRFDMTDLWQDVEYVPMYASPEQVDASGVNVLTLLPQEASE